MKFKFIYIFLILFAQVSILFAGGFEEDPGPEEMLIIESGVSVNQEIFTDQVYDLQEFSSTTLESIQNKLIDVDIDLDDCTNSQTIAMWSKGCVTWSGGYALWSGIGW